MGCHQRVCARESVGDGFGSRVKVGGEGGVVGKHEEGAGVWIDNDDVELCVSIERAIQVDCDDCGCGVSGGEDNPGPRDD